MKLKNKIHVVITTINNKILHYYFPLIDPIGDTILEKLNYLKLKFPSEIELENKFIQNINITKFDDNYVESDF